MLTDAVRRLDRDSDLIGEREPHHGERGAILVCLGLEKPGILFKTGPGQVGERGHRALPVANLQWNIHANPQNQLLVFGALFQT